MEINLKRKLTSTGLTINYVESKSRTVICHSRGRGLFRHCAYPTRGTGIGVHTREFPLDLYREHFQFAIFGQIQHNLSCNLLIKKANMWAFYLEKIVWFHEDLEVWITFTKFYIDFQWTAAPSRREGNQRVSSEQPKHQSLDTICDVSPTERMKWFESHTTVKHVNFALLYFTIRRETNIF